MTGDDFEGTGLQEDLVLAEIVSRVLDRGAVITGDVVISVAGIDLIQLGLNLYVASAEKARSAGIGPVRRIPPESGPHGPE